MRIHVVFSAGGVRCLSYAGAMQALEKAGFQIVSVSACSAGTFLAALTAAGMKSEELVHLVSETNLRKLAGKRRFPWPIHKAGLFFKPWAEYASPGFPKLVEA